MLEMFNFETWEGSIAKVTFF